MSDHFAGNEDSSLGWVVIHDWTSLSDLRYVHEARVESYHYCEGLPSQIIVTISGSHQYMLLADAVKTLLGLGEKVTGVFVTYKVKTGEDMEYMTDFFPHPLPGK